MSEVTIWQVVVDQGSTIPVLVIANFTTQDLAETFRSITDDGFNDNIKVRPVLLLDYMPEPRITYMAYYVKGTKFGVVTNSIYHFSEAYTDPMYQAGYEEPFLYITEEERYQILVITRNTKEEVLARIAELDATAE